MPPELALDAGGDLRVGLGGQPQEEGGIADRRMAHVGLQDRQQRADVLAGGEPCPQVVNRKSMPEIMDSGAVPPTAVRDAGLPEEAAEVVVDVHQRQGPALAPGKNHSQPGWPAMCAGAGQPFAQRA